MARWLRWGCRALRQVRPGYPDELFDEVVAVLRRSPVVVEVGRGTGRHEGTRYPRRESDAR